MNKKDLTDRRFDRLKVISPAPRGEKYPHRQWWHCQCDCGNTIDLPSSALLSGGWKSCGCLQKESRRRDLTGQNFGTLTALHPTGVSKNNSAVWLFHCNACGRNVEFPAESVLWGGRKSCGCRRKEIKAQQAREMSAKYAKKNLAGGTSIALIKKHFPLSENSSGVRGVNWHRGTQKWAARIQFQGKQYHLGYFDRIEDAAAARRTAETRLFDPFLRHHGISDPADLEKSEE